MNRDVIKGSWTEAKGHLQKMWSKLTDDDLEAIQADHMILAGKLQQRYGYAKDRIEEELDKFEKNHEDQWH